MHEVTFSFLSIFLFPDSEPWWLLNHPFIILESFRKRLFRAWLGLRQGVVREQAMCLALRGASREVGWERHWGLGELP